MDEFGKWLERMCKAMWVCPCGRTLLGTNLKVLATDPDYVGVGLPRAVCECGQWMEAIETPND